MMGTSLRVYLALTALSAMLASPTPALAVSEAERLWTVGGRAVQDGVYPQSRRTLERLVERFPSDSRVPDATLLLGKVRLAQNQLEPALSTFRKAQTFSPVPRPLDQ